MEGENRDGEIKYLIGRTAGGSGFIAAIIATHVATITGIWFTGVKLPKFDFNSLNGYIILGFTSPVDVTYLIGGVTHYFSGIIWGLIYALVIFHVLGAMKPLAPLNPITNYVKGLIWGWSLWLISSVLWMPLVVGSIGIPVGPFLTHFGTVGYQAVFTNLLWHTIYGLNLGLLFSPMRR